MASEGGEAAAEYWGQQWAEGTPSWHQDVVTPQLLRHFSHLCPPPQKHRVFVPLCGKSLDLKWLYDQGHSVVGVELVEETVKAFFEEHDDLNFIVKDLTWCILYTTVDRRLQVYVGDILELRMGELGRFAAVWDRGALVSIPPQYREKYGTIIKRMMRTHFRYFLCTCQYTPEENYMGPPFNIPNYLVQHLFGDVAVWKIMETHDPMPKEEQEEAGLDVFREYYLLLWPKKM